MRISVILVIVLCLSCQSEKKDYALNMETKPESVMVFDKVKWDTKEGKDHPYREMMLNDIVYNDTIRSLNKMEILELLGEPSYERDDENYLHYIVKQKRFGPWPLHTKAMVIKFIDENTIDWIKIYE